MTTKNKMVHGIGVCAAWLVACSSSSNPQAMNPEDAATAHKDSGGHPDAGHPDAGHAVDSGRVDSGHVPKSDGATPLPDAGHDAPHAADAADAKSAEGGSDAGPVRHVLVTYDSTANKAEPSVMFAVNLATGAVDGKVRTADTEAITDTSNALAPFLLNQNLDLIDRIDPTSWTVDGSWSVPLPGDPGYGSDAYAVSVATESKVYVIRYESNVIDVLDLTNPADAGAPASSIDLTSLAQPAGDGLVHAAAAVYVASSKLLYVALQNVNLDPTGEDDYMGTYYTLCPGTTSSVIAIDTTTDTVKSLGGTAPKGGIALKGFDPQSMTYDDVGGRLFLFHAGCNPAPTTDAGAPGAKKQAGVEEVDLTANTSTFSLDTSGVAGLGFPGSFVYIQPHGAASASAVLGFQYPTAAYQWTPGTDQLGAVVAGAPDLFDYDGSGNLVGAVVVASVGDAGATTNIVSLALASGVVTTLQTDVTPLGGYGYVASVGVWPRP